MFTNLNPNNGRVFQNLSLLANSPAINQGQTYSTTDPNDYPAKIEVALREYNYFRDFTALSSTEKDELVRKIREAYLYDIDGNRRSGRPDAGAYEKQ